MISFGFLRPHPSLKRHPYLYTFSLILKKQDVTRGAKIQSVVSGTVEEELERSEEEKQKQSSGKM